MAEAATAKERGLADLSRFYFTSPEDRGEPTPELVASARRRSTSAWVSLWNSAGPTGDRFTDRLSQSLGVRGRRVVLARAKAGNFFLAGRSATTVPATQLMKVLHSTPGPGFCLVHFDTETSEHVFELFRCGNASFIMVSAETDSLASAYGFLKQLDALDPVTRPVLVPVSGANDPWARIATLRLAEAATRFLGRRISIWLGNPGQVARRLENQLLPGEFRNQTSPHQPQQPPQKSDEKGA